MLFYFVFIGVHQRGSRFVVVRLIGVALLASQRQVGPANDEVRSLRFGKNVFNVRVGHVGNDRLAVRALGSGFDP